MWAGNSSRSRGNRTPARPGLTETKCYFYSHSPQRGTESALDSRARGSAARLQPTGGSPAHPGVRSCSRVMGEHAGHRVRAAAACPGAPPEQPKIAAGIPPPQSGWGHPEKRGPPVPKSVPVSCRAGRPEEPAFPGPGWKPRTTAAQQASVIPMHVTGIKQPSWWSRGSKDGGPRSWGCSWHTGPSYTILGNRKERNDHRKRGSLGVPHPTWKDGIRDGARGPGYELSGVGLEAARCPRSTAQTAL